MLEESILLHNHLPFPALVGLEMAQQALLLLAVEPRLQGIVLSASAGTGKSSLARGIRDLLGGDATAFVEAPPSADVENLLGGLDLEATLRTGRSVVQPGLLARAHEGIIYIDGINLLADSSANLLLGVLDEGEVRVERESISLRAPARFSLIGSYDPAEGLPRNHLLDRVGLLAPLPAALDARQRTAVIHNNLRPGQETWSDDTAFLRGLVRAGREQLPAVAIDEAQVAQLSATALAYGVEGHRVDLFAVRAACAAAALGLREAVEEEDLALAARLVILPRATRIPSPPPEDAPPPPQENRQAPQAGESPPPPEAGDEETAEQAAPPAALGPQPEQILAALASELPASLDELPFRHLRHGRTGSRGTTAGRRGRHVRSVPGDPRRARIDVVATLRAAAPWQPLRRQANGHANGQANGYAAAKGDAVAPNGHANGQAHGTAVAKGDAVAPNGHANGQAHGTAVAKGDAVAPNGHANGQAHGTAVAKGDAVAQRPREREANGYAAAKGDAVGPNGHGGRRPSGRVALRLEDIRVKQYRSKAGALFCFAVDASGSMALHRMRQAKGAVHALLEKAYVNRDRVALLAFRGAAAELLLPPTQSVELASRALDLLPTGGGTPLASALLLASDVARQAAQRGIMQTMLIMLTDGRANVALQADGDVESELRQLGRYIAASPLQVMIVDTQRDYLSRGEARRLAEWLGGEYAYLPQAGGAEIAALASEAVGVGQSKG